MFRLFFKENKSCRLGAKAPNLQPKLLTNQTARSYLSDSLPSRIVMQR